MTESTRKYDIYRSEREKGLTYREIAEKYGCSYQNVAQACGKQRTNYFRPYKESEVIYPKLRDWLNKNKVSRSEFGRRVGWEWTTRSIPVVSRWFAGTGFPQKETIDRILSVTGLTYEELWER